MAPGSTHRVAVDVGGTFIDLVLLDEVTGELVIEKQPARRETLVDEFLAGLGRLPVELAAIDRLFHGTTVGINAVLQERGATVGLLTTRGVPRRPRARAWLAARALQRALPAAGAARRPLPAPRGARAGREPTARSSIPLDLDALDAACDRLVAARGRRRSPICFLHAYASPEHERLAAARDPRAAPRPRGHRLARGGDRVARVRAHLDDRANAYIQPLMSRYLGELGGASARGGLRAAVRADAVERRRHLRRAGGRAADPYARVGPGRRRHRLARARPGARLRERHLRRRRRYLVRRRADRGRPHPRDDRDRGRRPAGRRAGDRHRLDRRGRRLDRVDRRARRRARRAALGRRLARAGVLRARRRRSRR